ATRPRTTSPRRAPRSSIVSGSYRCRLSRCRSCLRDGWSFLELLGRHAHSAKHYERSDGAGERERDERDEGPVVARREGALREVSGLRLRREDGRDDGDADCAADLLARVHEPRREPRLVSRDADEGGDRDRDEAEDHPDGEREVD